MLKLTTITLSKEESATANTHIDTLAGITGRMLSYNELTAKQNAKKISLKLISQGSSANDLNNNEEIS
jgi:hypothetical protein